eukprot:6017377-Amphidinium_carterae.1
MEGHSSCTPVPCHVQNRGDGHLSRAAITRHGRGSVCTGSSWRNHGLCMSEELSESLSKEPFRHVDKCE